MGSEGKRRSEPHPKPLGGAAQEGAVMRPDQEAKNHQSLQCRALTPRSTGLDSPAARLEMCIPDSPQGGWGILKVYRAASADNPLCLSK